MIFCCDIDGVLADFVKGFYTTASHVLEKPVPIITTTQHKAWNEFAGLSEEEVSHVWKAIKESTSFWLLLDSLVARSVFDKLNKLSITDAVYFVTIRPGKMVMDQTWRWLHLRGIYQPNVIVTEEKGFIAKGLKATHMLDDKPQNLENVLYHSPATKCFILSQPSNHAFSDPRIIRVNSAEEFFIQVTDLSAT